MPWLCERAKFLLTGELPSRVGADPNPLPPAGNLVGFGSPTAFADLRDSPRKHVAAATGSSKSPPEKSDRAGP